MTSTVATRPLLYRLTEIIRPGSPALLDLERLACETAVRPDPMAGVFAHRVVGAAVEFLGARRPASQLAAVLRADVLDRLALVRPWIGRLHPRLHRVDSQQPAVGVLEAWALVELRTGPRALSARFELLLGGRRPRWQCTALQLHWTRADEPRPQAGGSRSK